MEHVLFLKVTDRDHQSYFGGKLTNYMVYMILHALGPLDVDTPDPQSKRKRLRGSNGDAGGECARGRGERARAHLAADLLEPPGAADPCAHNNHRLYRAIDDMRTLCAL